MLSFLIVSTCILANTVIAIDMNFKVNGTQFLQKTDDGWKIFNKFAGVNLGITTPGFEPGQVILNYDDYILRFRRLEIMGSHVIRVYSLLQPDFYRAINDWNIEHKHKIYVLQGTAFPELEMEHNNGTDANDPHITKMMENYIKNTVAGVYGGGKVLYKYTDSGKTPIYGKYEEDISKYLIGWVISGEISPWCINKTKHHDEPYHGKYFSSVPSSSGFEIWVAKMFDLLATESISHGHMAPISHTNWVTTDGLSHYIEPRVGDREYGSVEDWMEFDLHNFEFSNWNPGMFFNQHAYPYYPEFVKIEGPDSFIDYIKKIRAFYHELPLIITEVGLPTSFGISSADRVHGRHHGHNGEKQRGDMMHEMLSTLINDANVDGVMVFQLHDEWFKKSWNTQKYDQQRQKWKNMLTSEQYFGIFEVASHPEYKMSTTTNMNEFYSVEIYNNYEYVSIEINIDEYYKLEKGSQINIGIDMSPGGTKNIDGIGSYQNNIDAYITITEDDVQFKISSEYNAFKSKYGLWLQPESFPTYIEELVWKDLWENNKEVRDKCYKEGCEFLNTYKNKVSFDDFKLLVKVPTIANWTDPACINGTLEVNTDVHVDGLGECKIENNVTFYNAQVYKVELMTKDEVDDENLALVNRNGNKINIKIPYEMLGFSDPSEHTKYFSTGLGHDYTLNYKKYLDDINFEFYYAIGAQFESSQLTIPFNWNDWSIPQYYMIKPKNDFNAFRNVFWEINTGNPPSRNLTQEELNDMIWYAKIPNSDKEIHKFIVYSSIIILIICLLAASVGKFILKHFAYCYSSQNTVIHSPRLAWINIIAALGLIWILFKTTFTVSHGSISYFFYILLIIWDSLIILVIMFFVKWNLWQDTDRKFDIDEHAFIIACHNSSDVIGDTLQSLLDKVGPHHIYVADNGSSQEEQDKTKQICKEMSAQYKNGKEINYGFMTLGNKTIAQYGSVCALPPHVKYVTCIDDDTRLDKTWSVHKVIKYFVDDEDVAVLAYPLTVDNPQYDIEWFQAMEYMIVGYIKIFHSAVYSTIFNSGAFGTYRVELLKEAFLYHNTDYHGDDLQICMHIHQLKGKKFYNHPNKIHTQDYKVVTATDMIVSTIVPKCWIHLSSISKCFSNNCDCGNPDLFGQRSKGWFVSMHRFIPRYIKLIISPNGRNGGLWVRMVAFYELVLILNEYFAIFYVIFFLKNFGMWLFEGFLIGYAFNILTMTFFNWFVLRPNNLYVPYEVITIQPLIYKIIMISIYRYLGLFYNMFVYSVKHKSGIPIIQRQDDKEFMTAVKNMYPISNV